MCQRLHHFWTHKLAAGNSILICVAASLAFAATAAQSWGEVPSEWLVHWDRPTLADRPLQIVHGLSPRILVADAVAQVLQQPAAQPQSDEGLAYYLRRGRGGIVCNVMFDHYLESEEHWKSFVAGVQMCAQLGMPVWIYDEKGYPSGTAGGLVLRGHPELEALVLARDPLGNPEYFFRRAYEHTHASNNYHALRRYINLMDERATARFIKLTHEAYYQRVGEYFGKTIVAFFTDEPSLMAVDLGPIPEPARSRVPVEDPVDPNVKPLPAIPWCHDFADVYRRRWGEDIQSQWKSLFEGDSSEDHRIRRQFWSTVADLVADRYFGQIQQWCRAHGVASSGHNLHEESIYHHVPLYGNGLKAISRMDIPGLDMLTSNPESVIHMSWMTAAMPLSGALLEGHRQVMTEVSDFIQKMSGAGPVNLPQMQATAGWQAAWGVTEFTLYYSPEDRTPDENWQYGQFVGRLNTILKPAMPQPRVALYYPIYDLWAQYRPVAGPLHQSPAPPRAQQIISSFVRIGQTLQRRQIPFILIDHEHLARAGVTPRGTLRAGNAEIATLVFPMGVELPPEARKVVEQFANQKGRVIYDSPEKTLNVNNAVAWIQPDLSIQPPNDRIVLGRFSRDDHTILVLVNVGQETYHGSLRGVTEHAWTQLDPATGGKQMVTPQNNALNLELAPYQTLLFVD